ncbi:MAG: hypothetical protein ABFD92_09080 [Planctomycetaceae bacterium]|nr:hypothetical protein [Planctomycetaceae bacterium]
MKNIALTLLNDDQKARVRAAIVDLERTTNAEVVAALVDCSRPYYRVELLAGAVALAAYAIVAGAMVTVCTIMAARSWAVWVTLLSSWTPWVIGAPIVFVLGALLGKVRAVASRLISAAERRQAALERAETLFIKQRMFKTGDGTGLLLAGFLFERVAVVYGDAAVNAVVKTQDWQAAVDTLVAGLHSGKGEMIANAYVQALGQLRTLLADKLPPTAANPDELPNELIVE